MDLVNDESRSGDPGAGGAGAGGRIRQFLVQARRSDIAKHASKLMSGRLAAMAIGIVGAPVVARLFVPGDYGVAAYFTAMTTVAAGVLPLGYQRAILFPREDRTAGELLLLVFAVAALLSAGLYILLGLGWMAGLTLPGPLVGSTLLWLLPLGALLMAVREALNVLVIRRREYGITAWADVLQSGATLLTRVIWGLALGSAAFGLVLGQLVGVVAAALLTGLVCRKWLTTALAGGRLSALTKVATEFSDYPKYRVFARLTFVAADQLPVLALGLMFPAATVGFFAMAHRVADLPLQAASRALGDALLGDAIFKRHQNRSLGPSVWKAAAGLALIGLPTFSVMFAFGGEILTWFLGARWSEAGRIVEILAVYLFFLWMNAPFAPVFETLRLNKQYMVLYTVNLVARIIVFAACFMAAVDIYTTLWVFSIVCACHSLVSITVATYVVRRHDEELRLGRG